ncbi:type III pantothenate kinase [Microbulbifer hainanensis]|uniref:type III pantothenate kinase n=1 Tax=Microbulbifer hainanensis TaxID=2735675 RepID=UPI0018691D61|nr:type III pantothenate kinase [Microbulbifer hainanensis]
MGEPAPILELDLGNTRGKWRLLQGSDVRARGSLPTEALRGGELPPEWLELGPQRVRAANVAGAAVATMLQDAIHARFGLEVEFARVEPRRAGVTCAYRDIARLGVDRWLAVLAAYRRIQRAALIVDCGSAVTLDLVDNGGQHLGGYILPGLELMRRALFKDTDAVKVPHALEAGMSLAPGRDTDSAVNRGLPLMVLGAVDRAYQMLVAAGGGEPLLWLTGGDGPFFSSVCTLPHQLVPELVLDGLAHSNP